MSTLELVTYSLHPLMSQCHCLYSLPGFRLLLVDQALSVIKILDDAAVVSLMMSCIHHVHYDRGELTVMMMLAIVVVVMLMS